jgi:tetratricopeptide (TPR) repeat protein/predicted Ser/Thr protein kinase
VDHKPDPLDTVLETARTIIGPADAPAPGDRDISLIRTHAAVLEAARAAARSLDPSEAISLARTLDSNDGQLSREQLGLVRTILGDSKDQGITDDPDLALRVLEPAADDRRLKDLIRARLFRSKAAPVKIGRYTILDRLGEGGMGVVYTAYDDKLDRKIAVKVMRSESEREDSVGKARLLREAQAMARLAHPNIVTVHEVGEVDRQVFVAMEFIRGQSLDRWLADPHPWREVLDVFVQAGRGLEAAHRAGLVHRDFKPQNVLVGRDGAIKVLDFGLARSVGPGEVEAGEALAPTASTAIKLLDANLTRTGALMGTPAYMAPEQHQGLPADARSDQFAFAVALFEGLYGQHPFDCSSLATLVVDVVSGKIHEPRTANKVPTWLRRAVQRGMLVEPERRYASMTDMLAELGRDPAAKRRRLFASTALAGFVGAASFGAATLSSSAPNVCAGAEAELAGVWDADRKAAVEHALLATNVPYAAETWQRVAPQLDAYAHDWAAMRTEACETHRQGTHSDRLYDLRTTCLDLRRASLDALAEALTGADATTVEKAATAAANLPRLASCADTRALGQAVAPPDDPRVAARVLVLREALSRVQTFDDAGKYRRGLELVAPLRGEAEKLGYKPLLAEAELREGSLEMALGDLPAAEASLSAALKHGIASAADSVALEALSKRIFLRAAVVTDARSAVADVDYGRAFLDRVGAEPGAKWLFFNNVGVMYERLGDPTAAKNAYDQILGETSASKLSPLQTAITLTNKGLLQLRVAADAARAIESFDEALRLAQSTLGAHHPHTLMISANLALARLSHGKYLDAAAILETTLADARVTFGAESPIFGLFLSTRGFLELDIRDYAAAIRTLESALPLVRGPEGKDNPETAEMLAHLGAAQAGLGDWTHALESHETAVRVLEGGDPTSLVEALTRYGHTLGRKGDHAGALARHQRALEVAEASFPPGNPVIGQALDGVGQALTQLARHDEAQAALQRALEIAEKALSADSPQLARIHRSLGELAMARGDAATAVTHFQRSLDVFAMVRDAEDGEMAVARIDLARALAARPDATISDRSAATTTTTAALAVLERKGAGWAPERDAATTWLKSQV